MKKYQITVNGNVYEVEVEEVAAGATEQAPAAPKAPVTPVAKAPAAAPKAAAPAAPAAGTKPVTAPMPGTILEVKVTVGQSVKRGEPLFILEAMKMENEIPAPEDGVIASVDTTKGASVASGAVLATLK
ncbi:MAG: acetyl-CoA carboxylase biotin carboxyl carrier protein subunit [Clostridia bacterium]|nr:acetyl-CoA carboxylase biotin carboxyl carrier protein subunit [Clostridia bacterium]MDY6184594.1 acetyl-CoA carboxylase biotin carboxyl carrier protein subunit [Eubacteriales bacterium]